MNPPLSPETDLELRKCVERAVRPVRATRGRKLRMREELYAHLLQSFSAERERQPDEQAALKTVCARFGPPAEVAASLQASLGPWERWKLLDAELSDWLGGWLSLNLEQPWTTFFLRTGLAWLAFVFLFLAIPTLLIQLGRDEPVTLLPKVWALIFVGQILTLAALRAAALAAQRSSRAGRWLVIGGQAAGWSLLAPLLAMLFWWSVSGELLSREALVRVATTSFLFLAPLLSLTAWLLAVDRRQHRLREQAYAAWTELALDE